MIFVDTEIGAIHIGINALHTTNRIEIINLSLPPGCPGNNE